MKGQITALLFLVGWLSIGAQPPLDSVGAWFERGERIRWLEAVSEWQDAPIDEVRTGPAWPEEFAPVLLPAEVRPLWARMPDEELWTQFQMCREVVDLQAQLQLQRPTLQQHVSPEWMFDAWQRSEVQPWQIASVTFAIGALVAAAFAWRWGRQLMKSLRPPSIASHAVRSAFRTANWSPEALEEWSILCAKNTSDAGLRDKEIWQRLNKSEQELAKYMAELLPVEAITARLSCSKSYVYNLRSSMRRKLEIPPEADLEREILRLFRKASP